MKKERITLTNPFDIPVKTYLPDDEVTKVVIAVHGFLGCKTGRVINALAERLTTQHTAVISFDLPAHGESKLTENELSVDSCIQSLLAVIDFVEMKFPEVYDYGIFATSFGAYVTLCALEQVKQRLGDFSLVLRAPAVLMHKSILRILRMTEDELREKGSAVCDFGSDRPVRVTYDFYNDIKKHNAYYDNDLPFMIIHGDRDTIVTREDVFGYLELNADAVYAPVKGASHTFSNEGDLEKIIGYADMWFVYRGTGF